MDIDMKESNRGWSKSGYEICEKGSWAEGSGYPDVSFLKGKEIVNAGILDRKGFTEKYENGDEGGFGIDYRDGDEIRRVVFGFNDLGFWICHHERLGA